MKLLSLNEASNQAILKLLESYEDWIEDSKTPEERQQKINYVEKVRAMIPGSEFGSTFGSNQKLKNQKIDSRESYGWIDSLPPEEKEKELKDQNLKPQYDFHKDFMKSSSFKNPKSTKMKVYKIIDNDDKFNFVKTDNIKGILNLNQEQMEVRETSNFDHAVELLLINSKVSYSLETWQSKIINSNLLVYNRSSLNKFELFDSTISCERGNFVHTKIENSKIKSSIISLHSCGLKNCDITSKKLIISGFSGNVQLDNILIEPKSKIFQIDIRNNEVFMWATEADYNYDRPVEMTFDEFKEKFSK